jgi:hypothetical protein
MISVLPRDPAATENHRLTMNQLSLCLSGLSPVQEKEIIARFDGGRLSSDGGVVLLREIEARFGLADRLSGCLLDGRDPERISHSYALMMRARIFAIACGHEDCDDLDALRFDPAFKLACGRLWRATGSIAAKPMGRRPALA